MLRGASADALATLAERLDALSPGAGDLAASGTGDVGSELFGVAGMLRSEPALRRVVTDVSVAGEAKEALVRRVFEGKLGAGALELVTTAARQRWTSARDLADALEHLGVTAVVKSAGDAGDQLESELFEVGRMIEQSPPLRDALSDPARNEADKRGLVRSILQGKARPATVVLVQQALSGSHRSVGVALSEYQKVAADVRGQRVATVRVARAMSDQDRRRLADALSREYNRPVHLNMVVDPAVVGGIRVEIGDDVIDGTVSSRLDAARRKLAG